jgi:hypothetical protein
MNMCLAGKPILSHYPWISAHKICPWDQEELFWEKQEVINFMALSL